MKEGRGYAGFESVVICEEHETHRKHAFRGCGRKRYHLALSLISAASARVSVGRGTDVTPPARSRQARLRCRRDLLCRGISSAPTSGCTGDPSEPKLLQPPLLGLVVRKRDG